MTPGETLRGAGVRRWLYDPKIRALAAQLLTILAIVLFAGWIVHNTVHNLTVRGIASGFGFLNNPAGFGILQTLIDYRETDTFARVFVIGLLNTLLVAALGIVLATVLGFLVGIGRLAENALIRGLSALYVEVFRNIPPLLQIFFWYFAVLRTMPAPRQSHEFLGAFFLNIRGLYVPRPIPAEGFVPILFALAIALCAAFALKRWARRRQEQTGEFFPTGRVALLLLIGLPFAARLIFGAPFTWELPQLQGFNFRGGWVLLPELVALTVALSLYTAAFIAETVRSGIQSVPRGQIEAAIALGLTPRQRLRLIVLPQAMRVIIPPLTSQYLNLTKNSSLGAAIGYPDLVGLFAGTVLNQTGQAIETIAMTMAVYLLISLTISLVMNWYNRRMALVER